MEPRFTRQYTTGLVCLLLQKSCRSDPASEALQSQDRGDPVAFADGEHTESLPAKVGSGVDTGPDDQVAVRQLGIQCEEQFQISLPRHRCDRSRDAHDPYLDFFLNRAGSIRIEYQCLSSVPREQPLLVSDPEWDLAEAYCRLGDG